jgi:DNA-directed RNA polymerase specialized sigma subunit
VTSARHMLTDRQLLVLILHYQHDWTFTSIARAIGTSRQSVSRSHVAAVDRVSACIHEVNGHNRVDSDVAIYIGLA